MALDHPDKVLRYASFDVLPTHHVLTHATYQSTRITGFSWPSRTTFPRS
jgi:hypothetical protein